MNTFKFPHQLEINYQNYVCGTTISGAKSNEKRRPTINSDKAKFPNSGLSLTIPSIQIHALRLLCVELQRSTIDQCLLTLILHREGLDPGHPTILCCRPNEAPPADLDHTSIEANAAASDDTQRGAGLHGDDNADGSGSDAAWCDEDPAAAAPRRRRMLSRLVRHRRAPLAPHMPTSKKRASRIAGRELRHSHSSSSSVCL